MAPKRARTSRKATSKKSTSAKTPLSRARAFQEEFYTDTDSGSESDGLRGEVSSRGQLKHKRGRKPKCPRTAGPQAPEISDGDVGDDDERPVTKKTMPASLVNSADGPLVQINVAELIANSNLTPNGIFHLAGLKFNNAVVPTKKTKGKELEPASFINLPPELAEPIYRKLFVTQEEPIMFTSRKGFPRSGQFLRTCRQIYEQGSQVLYGQNSFHFSRAHQSRGTYYEEEWKEVGYKDVRRFLNDIGNHNVARLKYISFDFEDALPTLTARLDNDARKYTNDAALIEVLKMLGKHTTLELLIVGFRGRSNLCNADYHFLQALCSIRCIEFTSDNQHASERVASSTYHSVKKLLTIPPQLVPNSDQSKNKYAPKMYRDNGRFNGGLDLF